MTYSVHEAKTHFSKLLDMVESGEEIIIVRHGQPVAQIHWTEGWEKPLTDVEADAFLEGRS
jgi:PHD/YefM family antitoxin component YafN of YafNO toxin-antitoxin module